MKIVFCKLSKLLVQEDPFYFVQPHNLLIISCSMIFNILLVFIPNNECVFCKRVCASLLV